MWAVDFREFLKEVIVKAQEVEELVEVEWEMKGQDTGHVTYRIFAPDTTRCSDARVAFTDIYALR